jgi:hypothetical protein
VPVTGPRLAVDLTGSLIRVLDGALGRQMRCGSGGTPAGSLVDGKVVDINSVGGALRQLLARTEISETRALIAASDAVATFRVLKLPPAMTDPDVDAVVARELALDPARMSTRWVDLGANSEQRLVYAVAWDRAQIKNITDAARAAGLDPQVVELKSACMARAVPEAACVVVDLVSNPAEIVLVDDNVPQAWHTFQVDIPAGDDIGPVLVSPLQTVLRFYKRRRDTQFDSSPVFLATEQPLSARTASALSKKLEHPVVALPAPGRVPKEVRHATYLTCLGLIMRRTS